jgi:hypothetical protein
MCPLKDVYAGERVMYCVTSPELKPYSTGILPYFKGKKYS